MLKNPFLFVLAAGLCTLSAAAPKITSVATVAAAADRTKIAAGSVFEITGEGFRPDALAAIPYPSEIDGVSVTFTLDGSDVAAYLISVGPNRIVGILPSTAAAASNYTATVTVNGEASAAAPAVVVSTNPGFVPIATGGNAGIINGRILVEGADPATITLASAVAAGSTIELDLTGLGPIDTPDNEAPGENNRFPDAVVLIGSLEIPVAYLGRNPSSPGYDKLLVTLPTENLPAGCMTAIRLRLTPDATPSAPSFLPILAADETACRHPMGVTPEGLATLAAGGNLVRGTFTLVRLSGQISAGPMTFDTTVDQFSGGFVSYTAEEIARMTARLRSRTPLTEENGCVVEDAFEGTDGGVYVDAGPSIKLVTSGWNFTVPRGTGDSRNQYNVVLSNLFNGGPIPGVTTPGLKIPSGSSTVEGPGGEIVGPFKVDLDVSTPMTWTNMADLKEIDTSADLVLRHSGARADDTIAASGLVKGPAPEDPAKIVNRIWTCVAPASEGRIVIPSDAVLKKLPRVTATQLADPRSGRYSSIALASYNPGYSGLINNFGPGIFRAPLTAGGQTELVPYIFSYTWAKSPMPIK
jgi:uncharacterized protein (TIGR03437 family)